MGFGAIDDELGLWPDTAVVETRSTIKQRSRFNRNVVQRRIRTVQTYQRGIGVVRASFRYREWYNGRLVVKTPILTCWLTDYRIAGQTPAP